MKRFLAALALLPALALAATTVPPSLINPAGSTTGQAILSSGPSTAPTWGTVSAGLLAPIAANSLLGNASGSSAAPGEVPVPSCSTANSALKYTSGTGMSCGTTFALTTGNLGQFASTTSAQLATVISNETGSGALVFGTSPTLTTPVISSITNTGTLTLPTSTDTLVGRATTDTLTNKTLTSPTVNTATVSGGTINNTAIGGTTPSTGAFTTLSASSTVSGTGFSTYLASPPAIGSTTASTGRFTTLQATSTITPSSTAGIVGTTTNDSANAGSVGEYVTATAGPTALTTGTNTNITSISLTAGDWDVTGTIFFATGVGDTMTSAAVSVNDTSATHPAIPLYNNPGNVNLTASLGLTVIAPVRRFSLASTTTVYLVATGSHSGGTLNATGMIRARRIR